MIAKGYEEEKASVLSYIIKDEDDLENLNQDDFDDIMLQVNQFVEDLFYIEKIYHKHTNSYA